MDATNTVAEEAVEAAVTSLEQSNNVLVTNTSVMKLEGSAVEFVAVEKCNNQLCCIKVTRLYLVCNKLDAMLDNGSPPDLLLDLTMLGKAIKVVKSLSLNLGLPTVSTALGEERGIR